MALGVGCLKENALRIMGSQVTGGDWRSSKTLRKKPPSNPLVKRRFLRIVRVKHLVGDFWSFFLR